MNYDVERIVVLLILFCLFWFVWCWLIRKGEEMTLGEIGLTKEMMGVDEMTREEAIQKYIMPALQNTWNDKVCKEVIQAMEPKQGEWIVESVDMYDDDVAYRCSVCDELFCTIEGTPADNLFNYCPNCGAKMARKHKDILSEGEIVKVLKAVSEIDVDYSEKEQD